MKNNPDNPVDQLTGDKNADVSSTSPQIPGWVPRWMSERERAALIIALGLVASAVILIAGAFALLAWASDYY